MYSFLFRFFFIYLIVNYVFYYVFYLVGKVKQKLFGLSLCDMKDVPIKQMCIKNRVSVLHEECNVIDEK